MAQTRGGVRCSLAAVGVVWLAGPVAALEGCFERTYSAAHLGNHPAQVVREISVAFGDFAGDDVPWMDVQAVEARGDGALFANIARCTPSDATLFGWSCSVECDGGTLHIEALDDRRLLMRTEYFLLGTGDECGGSFDLAEVPGQSVTYRLNRVPDARCAGRWD